MLQYLCVKFIFLLKNDRDYFYIAIDTNNFCLKFMIKIVKIICSFVFKKFYGTTVLYITTNGSNMMSCFKSPKIYRAN